MAEVQAIPQITVGSLNGTEETPKVEAPKVETAPTTPAEEPKKDFMSPRFAALAKKERAVRNQLNEAKKIYQQNQEFQKKFGDVKGNPKKALEVLGLTYEEVTNAILNGDQLTPDAQVKRVEEKLDRMQKQQEEEKLQMQKLAVQRAQAKVEQDFTAYKDFAKKYVETNKDKFEFTHMYEADNLIFDTQEQYFQKTGKTLPIEQAAEMVEDYVMSLVEKVTQSKKFQTKFMNKDTKKTEEQVAERKTLSNAMTSSAASMLPAKNEQDRIARAMAKLNGG